MEREIDKERGREGERKRVEREREKVKAYSCASPALECHVFEFNWFAGTLMHVYGTASH